MESQCMFTAAVPNHPTGPNSFRKENNDPHHGARALGNSNDTGRGGRTQPRGNLPYGYQNHPSSNERRIASITIRGSPSRPTSQMNEPIYVHNSQCVTPPRAGDTAANTRIFSDSQIRRKGGPNDARLWDNPQQFSSHQSPGTHEPIEKSDTGPQTNNFHQRSRFIPFEGHPNAKITEKASTFYYNKELMDQKPEFFNNRTLYVNGADVNMFLSHTLKNMMSEVGVVESISYLYSNPICGPAFVR